MVRSRGYHVQFRGWSPEEDVAERIRQTVVADVAGPDMISPEQVFVEFAPPRQLSLAGMRKVEISMVAVEYGDIPTPGMVCRAGNRAAAAAARLVPDIEFSFKDYVRLDPGVDLEAHQSRAA